MMPGLLSHPQAWGWRLHLCSGF